MAQATQEKLRRTGWSDVPFIVVMERTAVPRAVAETPMLLWRDAQGLHAENPLWMDPAQVRAVLDGEVP